MRLCLLIPPSLQLSSVEGQIALAWMSAAYTRASTEGSDLLCLAPQSFLVRLQEFYPSAVTNLSLMQLVIALIKGQSLPQAAACDWPQQLIRYNSTRLILNAIHYLTKDKKMVIHALFFPIGNQNFTRLVVTPKIDLAIAPRSNFRGVRYVVTFSESQAVKLRQAVDIDSSSIIYQPLGLPDCFEREQERVPKSQNWKMLFHSVELKENYVLIILHQFVKTNIDELLLAVNDLEHEVVFWVPNGELVRHLQKAFKTQPNKKQLKIVQEQQFPSAQAHLIINAALVVLPQPDLDAGLAVFCALKAGTTILLPKGSRGYAADLKGINFYRGEELAQEIKFNFKHKTKRHETTPRIRTIGEAFKELSVIYRRL